jgi:WD40 repeat protein
VISNGSGGMGKNVHAGFGANEDEVLVWSDFASCVKIWCLRTGRTVEIRDPKFVGKDGKGWGYRPGGDTNPRGGRQRGGVLAMLCRTAGADILLLLAPGTYKVLNRVELTTTDAAGLRWSRDGRWLAVWDAASTGYRLHIYTADGHLYRTITREPSDDVSEWDVEGLGIKTLEWVPGDDRFAVGGWDRRVRILSTRTFAPVVFLDHTPVIDVPSAPVYSEHVDSQGNRSYTTAQQPVTPPKAPLEKNETGLMKQGIGMLTFNADGTLCATRDDSTPCTVWIWDLTILRPRCILIQYSPVKNLLWHPTHPNRLLIQTTQDEPTVYLWTAASPHSPSSSSSHSSSAHPSSVQHPPAILTLAPQISKPAGSAPPRWSTTWLFTPPDKKPALLFGHQQAHVLVWPEGKDKILRFERDDEQEDSDDSLFDILTGRTPIPELSGSVRDVGEGEIEGEIMDEAEFGDSVDTVQGLDDTFRGKRGREDTHDDDDDDDDRQEEEGGQSPYDEGVLGESGMSEMF